MVNPIGSVTNPGGARARKSAWQLFFSQRYIQIFALCGMAYLFIFSIIPMVGLIIGFKNYSIQMGFTGFFTSEWVGLKYFIEFFNEYNIKALLRNTLAISVLKLIFTFPAPILFALMLNEVRNKAVKRIVQTVSYMPYFISWVIVSGFAVVFLNSKTGLVNDVALKLGWISSPMNILSDSRYYWPMAVLTAVWKETGWWTIVFLAVLTGIDPTLYEAATIDGASRFKRICYITFPGMLPTITVVLILAIGNLLGGGLGGSNFEQSYLLGNPGNMDASDIIQSYVFRVGLSNGRYAYATAVSIVQSVISVLLIFLSNNAAKKITGEGLF